MTDPLHLPIEVYVDGYFADGSQLDLYDDSTGFPSEWLWQVSGSVYPFSTEQNPMLADISAYLDRIVNIEGTDYLPITLTINGGISAKTRYIPIIWLTVIGDFSWEPVTPT